MRLLELFSGTGSIGRAFRRRGWEVVSIDNDPKAEATICADLLTFDYHALGGSFDCIWASPPCTQYSIARSKSKTPRDLVGADSLVSRDLEVIQHFQPATWWLENPQSGMLKGRAAVAGLPWADVDYCSYGWPYRKRTRLWTNCADFAWAPLCRQDCAGCENGWHRQWAQKAGRGDSGCFTTRELYVMPPLLCEDILAATRRAVGAHSAAVGMSAQRSPASVGISRLSRLA